jgi:3-dehydroquinate synthase
MAADLSARLGWLNGAEVARVTDLLRRAHLPVQPPAKLGSEAFLRLMAVDKKARDGRLRFILLKALGQAVIAADIDPVLLRATLESACQAVG